MIGVGGDAGGVDGDDKDEGGLRGVTMIRKVVLVMVMVIKARVMVMRMKRVVVMMMVGVVMVEDVRTDKTGDGGRCEAEMGEM